MKYYIIAGEASGDLHGSNLIKALKKKDTNAQIRCWGGDKMRDAGGELVVHYKEIAFMGFWEVIKHLPLILKKISFCKEDISKFNPDAVVLIDYPGFNLRLIEFLSEINKPVFYYISPQIWAWKESRIHKIKKFVNKMIVILPFEKEFYSKWGMEVDYVGHPLLDVLEDYSYKQIDEFQNEHGLGDLPIIALLPGSRKQEILKMLKEMISVVDNYPSYQFVVGGLSHIPKEFYENILSNAMVKVVFDDTYNLVKNAEIALVTSGTATLETALIGTPQIVCYKGSLFSYIIGRMLVKVDHIAMPNLIMNTKFLPELIQADLTRSKLINSLDAAMKNDSRAKILEHYASLRDVLKGKGASEKAGSIIVEEMLEKHSHN